MAPVHVATAQALLLHLPTEHAARVGGVVVLCRLNDDDLVLDVYHAWREADGGYEASDRASLTPEVFADVQDLVRRQRGSYTDARHANGAARDAARPLAPSQRWAGMRGRARRSA